MELNMATIGVIITVLMSLLGLAYGYGALSTKVRFNRKDIDGMVDELRRYQRDNKDDHNLITAKLDQIIRNGNGRHL